MGSLRPFGFGFDRIRRSYGPADPSAGYQIYLPFSAPTTFRAGSNTAASFQTLPGAITTRTGAKGELNNLANASDVIDDFATDVAAIMNGVGLWSRPTLTNLLLQSQTLDNASWTKSLCTVTANAAVAPDGTTTVDRLTTSGSPANINQSITVSATTARTCSVFVPKTGGGFPYVYFNISDNVANAGLITMTVATGVVGTQQITAGAGLTMVAYSVDCGTFWRFVVTWTTTANLGPVIIFGPSNTINANTITTNADQSAWQLQDILGNHPAGGPIITTVAATQLIGADVDSCTMTNGTYNVTYTFQDDTTDNVPALVIAGGVYTVPTTYSKAIKLVTAV